MRHVSKLAVLMSFVVSTSSAVAGNVGEGKKLLMDLPSNAKVSVDETTGNARFMRLTPSPQLSSLRLSVNKVVKSTEQSSLDFLHTYGSAFGIKNLATELPTVATVKDPSGAEHNIFKQQYKGIPVFGGELRAHYAPSGQMIAVNGNFLSDIKVATKPQISPELAAKIAIVWVSRDPAQSINTANPATSSNKEQILSSADLRSESNTLMIFREGLLQGVKGADHLVYEVEVGNKDGSVREFVYVDAISHEVVDQITGIHEVLNRRAYDAESQPHPGPNYPGSPYWVEGDPFPTASIEADNMITSSAETFSFFFNAYGRDSFDDAGATMDAIFNRGDACPNASWNGTYISFCPGLTSDDVTAHEWSHAYTEYTNNLIYQWQSGALNESYSDIWGETVDRINGRDDIAAPDVQRSNGSCSIYGAGSPSVDDSVRWLMGEDTSGFGGAIRDMWNPTCYGDPGKVSDGQYYCASTDQGGVHTNSGVPNHAYALMTDGGTYNGYTGPGLGLTKSAHIHWVAQNMLTPSSNFLDHADALEAACSSLIGVELADLLDGTNTGEIITLGNCDEVSAIIEAVELRTAPVQCGFELLLEPDAPALCEGLGEINTFFSEDFESNTLPVGWTVGQHDVANPATFSSPGWEVVGDLPANASGSFAAFGPDLIAGNCADDTEAGAISLDSPIIALPLNEVPHVAFTHWVATEKGWDGGNLKISVNGGGFVVVPASAYSFNAYNSSLTSAGSGSDNPLAGQPAFTGANEGDLLGSWGQSQINLYGIALPGDNIQLRFDLGTDGCNGVAGWYVDNVEAYSCSTEVAPFCGDGVLLVGEQCDDGNSESGDGCSSSCQIESGYVCTSPTSPIDSTNIVGDWSFEGGVPNAEWTPSSSFGGLSGFPLCGPGNGCPAVPTSTGSWVVWIGGLSAGVTSSVAQDITIPATATELSLKTLRGICGTPGETLHISIDGTDIGTLSCDTVDGGYVARTFPLAPFNDGQVHSLEIGGSVGGINGNTNFFVDDVIIEDNVAVPSAPSICRAVVNDISCNSGTVTFDSGVPDSWTVIDNESTGIVWTNIASSGIGGNYTGGTGDATSVSSDAFPGEFDTELRTNTFSLLDWTSAKVEYLINYQNYAGLDFLNLDVSTDGGSTWDNLLSWNEDHPVGGLFAAPGEAVSVDLSAYAGQANVTLRWHYFDPNTDDYDWYAQVDNVMLSCENEPQALQCDINGDGFVDRSDIALITAARNQPAAPGDPRDNDGNGVINVSDARQCTLLCTSPRCAPAAP
jgi:cysteine-rich repeat protein